jgi:CRP-like cAMP-binding protein
MPGRDTMLDERPRVLAAGASALARTLLSYEPLDPVEVRAVEAGLGGVLTHRAGSNVELDGEGLPVLVVADGWAASVVALEPDRRQIVDLHLAGDVVDMADLQAKDLTLTALTRLRVQTAGGAMARLHRLGAPGRLGRAWRLKQEADRRRAVRHIVRLGRMSAYQRIADFLLELQVRQQRATGSAAGVIDLPLTQDVLADHLGLSVVHVNRVLQQIRRDGLIACRGARIAVRDPARLAHHALRA